MSALHDCCCIGVQWQAERYQFAVVGVDSLTRDKWRVPLVGQDPTADTYHALASPIIESTSVSYSWDRSSTINDSALH